MRYVFCAFVLGMLCLGGCASTSNNSTPWDSSPPPPASQAPQSGTIRGPLSLGPGGEVTIKAKDGQNLSYPASSAEAKKILNACEPGDICEASWKVAKQGYVVTSVRKAQ